jgi:hypothetical protein
MNTTELRTKLEADGIPTSIIDSIINSAQKEKKKGQTKKNGFFAGCNNSKKVSTPVEVTTKCECCGSVEHSVINVELLPGSPTTQKVATSLCSKCPDELRKLSFEQLVSIIMLKCHPATAIHYNNNVTHIRMSGMFTPEDIVTLKPAHY